MQEIKTYMQGEIKAIISLFSASLLAIFMPREILAADKELIESAKCSRFFPLFERKFHIPRDTLHSISLKESGKQHTNHKIRLVWPWTVNVEGQGYYFNNKREAISFVKKQMLDGKESIDIGCMQINLKHHPQAFISIEQAFDPKSNIAYGAEFLRSKYEQSGNWHKAIAHYHSSTHELGFKYKQEVFKIASNMDRYKSSLQNYTLYYLQGYRSPKISPGILIQDTANPPRLASNSSRKLNAKSNISANQQLAASSKYHRLRSNMMVYVAKKYNK